MMIRRSLAILALAAGVAVFATVASARLVSVEWLRDNLANPDVVLIDASPSRLHAAKHIPGAIGVDLYAYGSPNDVARAEMERRIRSWGISPGKKVVIYDEGASMTATWMFYDLHYHGHPASDLAVLDGGLAKWEAQGGTVTRETTPPPSPGTFTVGSLRESERVRLAEFLTASGEPGKRTLVDALDASYHFGATKFFDRAGHVPHAVMLPVADLFNADKTFKSPAEIAKIARFLNIAADRPVYTYCGGGIAATVPWFALRFIAGYPDVRVYRESQLEWLQDERGLPLWTYAAPSLQREKTWLNGWNSPLLRMYGATRLSIVDVRSPDAYRENHLPFALNVPSDIFHAHLRDAGKLASALGASGVDPASEAVIVSDGGVTPASALAFLMLERIGQRKVSLLVDSIDDWAFAGYPLTKQVPAVRPKQSPLDVAIPPAAASTSLRDGTIADRPQDAAAPFPRVYVASGATAPQARPDARTVHVPYTSLLTPEGKPKPAHEIWSMLAKAGVPRYAELVVFADEPGHAAVNYFVLRLMGFPDVKVLLL